MSNGQEKVGRTKPGIFGSKACAPMLVALAASSIGCASQPAPLIEAQEAWAPSPMPRIRQELPAESYSLGVQRNIFRWANELTDTPATSEP
jgi:hypothetical protein